MTVDIITSLAVSRYCGRVGDVTSVPQGGLFRNIAQSDILPDISRAHDGATLLCVVPRNKRRH